MIAILEQEIMKVLVYNAFSSGFATYIKWNILVFLAYGTYSYFRGGVVRGKGGVFNKKGGVVNNSPCGGRQTQQSRL